MLVGQGGDLKIDARILIGLLCGGNVELVNRDAAALLVLDIEGGPGQQIVMNLLRRPAVFED
jgi:hypothetical protein